MRLRYNVDLVDPRERRKREAVDIPVVHLLHVEHDAVTINAVRDALEPVATTEYRMAAAGSLKAALAIIESDPVDQIIMSLLLPDGEGVDLFSRMHNVVPDIPIVVMSSIHDDIIAAKVMRLGAQDYLLKDQFETDLLHRTLWRARERKSYECSLLADRDLLDAVLDGVPDLIYFKDSRSRFTRINRALASRLGLDNESEAIGKTDFEFFADRHAQATFRDEQALVNGKAEIIVKEEKEFWPDDSSTWVSTVKLPLRFSGGEVVGTFGISRDITARKVVEEESDLANTRQEQITKQETLGTVAWGVANEFNNMLTTILCNTGLALMELPQDHPVWNYVEVIEKVTDRAAALVNRLVTASGRGECAMAHVDLPELLHGMMPEIQEKIPSGVEFRPSVTPGPPPIKADAGLLRQLIMSLVQNAADVMSDRIGSIAVATGTEDCTGEDLSAMALGDDPRPGAYTYVEVSDTGGGIAPDIEKQMFDPFFSTKPMAHGLGLAVVAGVTRQHKGAVLVRTNSRGTTVRLLFPVARQVVAPVAPPASEPEPAQWRVDILQWRGHGTVLVIDDEANLCQAVERVLQLFGFDVLTAGGGEQGIDLFHEHMDDVVLVLLDQVMPVMGGEQVFDALKAIRPSLPIILSTGYAEEDVMDIVSAKGFSGFIQKPYEPTKLVERVRSVLEG